MEPFRRYVPHVVLGVISAAFLYLTFHYFNLKVKTDEHGIPFWIFSTLSLVSVSVLAGLLPVPVLVRYLIVSLIFALQVFLALLAGEYGGEFGGGHGFGGLGYLLFASAWYVSVGLAAFLIQQLTLRGFVISILCVPAVFVGALYAYLPLNERCAFRCLEDAQIGVQISPAPRAEQSKPATYSIVQVSPDAAQSGLRNGDVIAEIEGQTFATEQDLIGFVRRHHPGDSLTLTLKRGGRLVRTDVVLTGERRCQDRE